jgi:acetyltransferase-like isoleucine patch superfamily enzyme
MLATSEEEHAEARFRFRRGSMLLLPRIAPPAWLVETLVRVGAPLVGLLRPHYAEGAEDRLRGMLLGWRFGVRGLAVGRGVTIAKPAQVRFGDGVRLAHGVYLNANGPRGRIEIGARSHVDVHSVLYGQGGLQIGSGCAIAGGVLIYSQTNRFDLEPEQPIIEQGARYAAVEIGDDVWIGAGAVILPGVRVGDHAVVAAGGVVRSDVPAWQVVAGVPARIVKDRRDG